MGIKNPPDPLHDFDLGLVQSQREILIRLPALVPEGVVGENIALSLHFAP